MKYITLQENLKAIARDSENKDNLIKNLTIEVNNYEINFKEIEENFLRIKEQFDDRERANTNLKSQIKVI